MGDFLLHFAGLAVFFFGFFGLFLLRGPILRGLRGRRLGWHGFCGEPGQSQGGEEERLESLWSKSIFLKILNRFFFSFFKT